MQKKSRKKDQYFALLVKIKFTQVLKDINKRLKKTSYNEIITGKI